MPRVQCFIYNAPCGRNSLAGRLVATEGSGSKGLAGLAGVLGVLAEDGNTTLLVGDDTDGLLCQYLSCLFLSFTVVSFASFGVVPCR